MGITMDNIESTDENGYPGTDLNTAALIIPIDSGWASGTN